MESKGSFEPSWIVLSFQEMSKKLDSEVIPNQKILSVLWIAELKQIKQLE